MSKEVKEEVKNELMVKDFNMLSTNRKSKTDIFTNITDTKELYNLENRVDYRINDCKGELIRVKKVLIKLITTPLEEPIVNDETGEVTEYTTKKITILVDDQGKSYVTASKMFTLQMIRYIEMFGIESIENGLDIKIIEKSIKNSSNMALGFELA